MVDMVMHMLGQAMDWSRIGEIGRSLGQHLPHEGGVVAIWPLVVLLAASVFVGLHGERLTRLLVLGLSIGLAALLGQRLVEAMTLPFWPTLVLCGAVGGILAHMFYRWSLGLALAVILALAAGTWSAGSSLTTDEIRALFSGSHTLSDGGSEAVPSVIPSGAYTQYLQAAVQRAMHLWSSVADKPDARKHLLLTMLAGAAVGLLAGLVLGRLAAILWTSVLAAAGLIFALTSLAVRFQPQWGASLSDNRQYVLLAGVTAALLFMLRQLGRTRPTTTIVTVAPASLASSQDKS